MFYCISITRDLANKKHNDFSTNLVQVHTYRCIYAYYVPDESYVAAETGAIRQGGCNEDICVK